MLTGVKRGRMTTKGRIHFNPLWGSCVAFGYRGTRISKSVTAQDMHRESVSLRGAPPADRGANPATDRRSCGNPDSKLLLVTTEAPTHTMHQPKNIATDGSGPVGAATGSQWVIWSSRSPERGAYETAAIWQIDPGPIKFIPTFQPGTTAPGRSR